jgi:hypothetical protein
VVHLPPWLHSDTFHVVCSFIRLHATADDGGESAASHAANQIERFVRLGLVRTTPPPTPFRLVSSHPIPSQVRTSREVGDSDSRRVLSETDRAHLASLLHLTRAASYLDMKLLLHLSGSATLAFLCSHGAHRALIELPELEQYVTLLAWT